VSTNGSADGPEPLRPNRSERGGLAISVVGCGLKTGDLAVEYGPALPVSGVTRRLASSEARARGLGFTAMVNLGDGFRQLFNWWGAGKALESAPAGALV
jgi:hypothetical protein